MSQNRYKLIEEFLLSYRTTGQLLIKYLHAVLEDDAQTHFSGLLLLKTLKKSGSLSQRAIAQTLCHSEAAISRQVALAQEKGLVQVDEDPGNRRALIISLTDKGEEVVAAMNTKAVGHLAAILGGIRDEDLKVVLAINTQVQNILLGQTTKEADAN